MRTFKILIIVLGLITGIANSQSIMRGEVTPGSYNNIKTDSSGNLYTTANSIAAVFTDRSGTITNGGTAQSQVPANANRKYILIQNNSDTNLWFNFTTTAVQSQPSILLIPNASFFMETRIVGTEAISVIGPTTGKSFTIKEF